MSQDSASAPSSAHPPIAPVGVMECIGMGWRLMMSDFWRLWVVAFVTTVVWMGASVFGMAATIVVLPPLLAGLYYAVARRIDGGPAEVADLFAGFKHRFGPSVVGMLPVTLGSVAIAVPIGLAMAALFVLGLGIVAAAEGQEEVVAVVVVVGILAFLVIEMVLIAALMVYALFFRFVPLAVWDHPESGWEAAKASARLVRDHFPPMVGFFLVFWLIAVAAQLIGLAACCVGVFFTGPVVTVWFVASLVYLYRSWTGRPLVSVPAAGDGREGGGN